MSNIHVCKHHDLDEGECRAVAEELLNKLVEKYGGSFTDEGDHYIYKHGTGINAFVQPYEGELSVRVKLGLMTRALGPRLEREINRVLDEHIG